MSAVVSGVAEKSSFGVTNVSGENSDNILNSVIYQDSYITVDVGDLSTQSQQSVSQSDHLSSGWLLDVKPVEISSNIP